MKKFHERSHCKIPEAEVETDSSVLEKFGAEMTPVKIKGQEKTRKKTMYRKSKKRKD